MLPMSSGQWMTIRLRFFCGKRLHGCRGVLNHACDIELLDVQFQAAGLDLGEIENLIDEFEQMLAGTRDTP